MTGPSLPQDMLELMVDQATEGLAPAEAERLEVMLRRQPELDPDEISLLVAKVDRVFAGAEVATALPSSLKSKLLDQARARATTPESIPFPTRSSNTWTSSLGWLVAAAASIVAVISWLPGGEEGGAPLSARALLGQLVAEAPDLVRASWKGLEDPRFKEVEGEVVWSDERQQGYMVLRGMPINEPTKEQYQLWIVDPARDARPVDGGVFDLLESGEVIVPIEAKLRVKAPTAFVLTAEQPGGVVVSDGPHLVLAAP